MAIEPVSNFIVLEEYQPARDAEIWNRCLSQRLAGTPVTVCQVTSDQASALITHATVHLEAHHSPDLFHVQYDTVRATSAALAGQTRRAQSETKFAVLTPKADLMSARPNNEEREGWSYLIVPLAGSQEWERKGDLPDTLNYVTLGFDSWGAPPLEIWVDGMSIW